MLADALHVVRLQSKSCLKLLKEQFNQTFSQYLPTTTQKFEVKFRSHILSSPKIDNLRLGELDYVGQDIRSISYFFMLFLQFKTSLQPPPVFRRTTTLHQHGGRR